VEEGVPLTREKRRRGRLFMHLLAKMRRIVDDRDMPQLSRLEYFRLIYPHAPREDLAALLETVWPTVRPSRFIRTLSSPSPLLQCLPCRCSAGRMYERLGSFGSVSEADWYPPMSLPASTALAQRAGSLRPLVVYVLNGGKRVGQYSQQNPTPILSRQTSPLTPP
jgi:hypothetical protein